MAEAVQDNIALMVSIMPDKFKCILNAAYKRVYIQAENRHPHTCHIEMIRGTKICNRSVQISISCKYAIRLFVSIGKKRSAMTQY